MRSKLARPLFNILVAAIAALIVTFCLSNGQGDLGLLGMVAAVMTVAFVIGITSATGRYDARLVERMNARQPAVWDIWMNSVLIGTVSDAEYAAMQRSALRDWRLAAAQLLHLIRLGGATVVRIVVAVPLMVFWAAIAAALFIPESYAEVWDALRAAGPTAITAMSMRILELTTVVLVVAGGGALMLGCGWRARNLYSEAVNRQLQKHCNTASTGDIALCRRMEPDTVASGS